MSKEREHAMPDSILSLAPTHPALTGAIFHPTLAQVSSLGIHPVLAIVLGVLALALVIGLAVGLIVPIARAVGWIVRHVFAFLGGEISDIFRLFGALITAIVFIPLTLINILIGRWSAAKHYGSSLQSEGGTALACLYRILISHPLRLIGLAHLVQGLEERVPQAVAAAPGADKPSRRTGQFDGYAIVGSLQGGGSGGKLYIAQPDAIKRASFERAGQFGVGQVVIKAFSLRDGSSLPQIIRESRALEAAKKLGLVLDHEMTGDRFFYVMRYVPGQSLSLVMQGLHAASPTEGLTPAGVRSAMVYAADLLKTLDTYHRGGLWHKDVKPDNIIVDGQHAHLVDFGLLTHLSSAMTLTTHGTEYFRDPELVRMALRGVKVHEVDGAKFDLYAAGAVLYAMIENSFPAHGALSQINKRCPDALRWIVRRAMTEYDKRYTSAAEMLLDLETIRSATDPFAVTPAMLPSMRAGLAGNSAPETPVDPFIQAAAVHGAAAAGAAFGSPAVAAAAAAYAGSPTPPPAAAPAGRSPKPKLRVINWWTGRYASDAAPTPASPANPPAPWPPMPPIPADLAGLAAGAVGAAKEGLRQADEALRASGVRIGHVGVRPVGERAPAAEQIRNARERAQAARARVANRMHRRGSPTTSEFSRPNRGVIAAVAILVGLVGYSFLSSATRTTNRVVVGDDLSFASGPVEIGMSEGELARVEALAAAAEARAEAESAAAEARASAAEAQAEALAAAAEARDEAAAAIIEAKRDAIRAQAEARAESIRATIEAKVEQLHARFDQIHDQPEPTDKAALAARENAIKALSTQIDALEKAMDAIDPGEIADKAAQTSNPEAGIPADLAAKLQSLADFSAGFAEGYSALDEPMKNLGQTITENVSKIGDSINQAFARAARVAVVVDLPKPLSKTQEEAVARILERLTSDTFIISGDFPAANLPASDSARNIETAAAMLKARGVNSSDSKEARQGVAQWLASEKSFDAALWIVPAKSPTTTTSNKPEEPAAPVQLSFVVVAPESKGLDEARAAHVKDVVRRVIEHVSGQSADR
jgi:serine/threonine protein kinase